MQALPLPPAPSWCLCPQFTSRPCAAGAAACSATNNSSGKRNLPFKEATLQSAKQCLLTLFLCNLTQKPVC